MGSNQLPNSDWLKRHHPISFRKLMALEPVPDQKDVYQSLSSAYPPTATPRAYGGHVFAQAVWAASRTVTKNQFFVHNVTGWFLLMGDTSIPFRYHVRRIRDGGVYCLRGVEVFQDSEAGEGGTTPCFVATVSFKRDESSKRDVRREFRHQDAPRDHIDRTYGVVLEGKRFEDHMLAQGADGFWSDAMTFQQWRQRGAAYPGLEMRRVDMRAYNGVAVEAGMADGGKAARRWRLLLFYRMLRDEDVPTDTNEPKVKGVDEDDLNLHACAHLYASDRNSLFLVQRALGFEKVQVPQMGSLAHTVHFHVSPKQWKMIDEATGQRKMYVQESWTSHSGEDRGCHESRLWDYENGVILATSKQDGMVRVPRNGVKYKFDGNTPPRSSKL